MNDRSSTYIMIAHGSREEKSNQAFFDFLDAFRRAYPHRKVEPSFLELAEPGIPEAIEKSVREGAREIFVIPLMLFPGRHVKDDIPRFIEEAKTRHPEIDFHYGGPLTDHPMMLELLEEKAKSIHKKTFAQKD